MSPPRGEGTGRSGLRMAWVPAAGSGSEDVPAGWTGAAERITAEIRARLEELRDRVRTERPSSVR